MKHDIKSLTAERLREYKKNRQWLIIFLGLAVTVVLGTLAALKLYGQAMTHQVKVLKCGFEVHEHTEECYTEGEEKELICVYADYVVHVHNDDCRDSNGNLVCHLDEVEVHEHDESCWQEEKILVCEEEETAEAQPQENQNPESQPEEPQNLEPVKGDLICGKEEHAHGDGCYSQALTCGAEEHTHGDGCYDEEGNLICEVQEHVHGEGCYSQEFTCEVEEHAHEDACYEWITPEPVTPEPITPEPEEPQQVEGHVHTDACYMTEKVLSCGKLELHIHEDECYAEESFDEDGKLIEGSLPVCGLLQLEEHVHGEGCFEIVELTAEEVAALNAGATLHIHEDSCYDEENNLICGHEVTHLHGLECYDEAGKLICGFAEDHVHSGECFDGEGNLICGQEEIKEHEHDENCYDIDGNLICEVEDAVDHVHGEGCLDEDGNLVCGYEEHEVFEQVQTFEAADHSYIVIARYNQDAELPENAQFRADMITPEMDSEHYAKREAEYREETGNEDASMRALLKIGFYVDGEEVEPKAPVSITIQFLDEEGLAEGAPITVVHFAEEGTETLDGSHAKDDSTTFKMNGFSEIAIGYGTEEPREVEDKEDGTRRIQIDDTFEYEDDAFHMTFHIKGEAILPEGAVLDEEKEEEGAVQNTVPDGEEGQPEEETGQSDEEGSVDAETDVEAGSSGAEGNSEPEDGTDASDAENQIEELVEEETPESTEGAVEEGTTESAEEAGGEELSAETEGETPKAPQEDGEKKSGWEPKLQLKVELLSKDSEEYQVFANDFNKTNVDSELFRLQVMKYSLTYEGIELDLSECIVTVQVRMTKAFQESVEGSIPEAAAFLANGDGKSAENNEEAVPEDDETLADEEEESEQEESELGEETPAEDGTSAMTGSYLIVCSEDIDGGSVADEPADVADENADADNEENEPSDSSDMKDTPETAQPQETSSDNEVGNVVTDGVDKINLEIGEYNDGRLNKLDATFLDGSAANAGLFSITLQGNVNTIALFATGQPNPKFTVQYYANLNVIAHDDSSLSEKVGTTKYTNELPVIDTSGGKLPQNGTGTSNSPNSNAIRTVYVNQTTGKLKTKAQLTEVYSSRNFEYHKAPTINYMNALIKNGNYKLKEVWVLNDGKKATSTKKSDWTVYTYNSNLHFTNRAVSATGNNKYILLKDNTVLRFVYDTVTVDRDLAATFYDYDITDGKIYPSQTDAKDKTNAKNTSNQKTGTWWANTKQAGINSSGNYSGSGAKFAFGNTNTGSGLQFQLWNGNLLNKYNGSQDGYPTVTGSYQGCTFGMVTGLKADGTIQYASGLRAPKLFNETGNVTGKSTYNNYSLKFNRVGDTYTLTAVNGAGANASGLDTFNHPSPYSGKVHNHIWTNNFWPMDSATGSNGSYGTNGHDMKFGSYDNRAKYNFYGQKGDQSKLASSTATNNAKVSGQFPYSDDGLDHNSNFGMHYEVEFDLVADYVGPLEYYFFGDDDMWVFLDGRLVCDIGGVHSSVGEYVNLWDYIAKGSEGSHKLSFFYTERGESGSSCWMQFTLPSVSSVKPVEEDPQYGELKIEKTVTQINNDKETVFDNGDEFSFTINLTDANGNKLPDDYSYLKYDKAGNEIDHDLIIWDGGEFTLKNGEYIIIKYLPKGAKFKVIEANTALTVTDNTSRVEYFTDITGGGNAGQDLTDNKVATGSISKGNTVEVKYNNKFYVYALPETGGSGTILYTMAGAIVVLFGAGLLYRKKFRERRA